MDDAHDSSHDTGPRTAWGQLNTPLPVDPRGMRVACTVLLIAYSVIAISRAHHSLPFFWLRAAICLYAVFGIWLAGRVTWRSVRLYTMGLALLLPLQAAYVNGMLGNHMSDVAVTALATFVPLVFMQAGLDIVLIVPAMVAGHAAVLSIVPEPAVPLSIVAILLGGAIATGVATAIQSLFYRGRWSESVTRLEEAFATSAEWQNRYEAAILASGQLLYDWNPSTNDVRWGGACERLLGYSGAELSTTIANWVALVHPDDVASVEAEIRRVLAHNAAFDLRYRMRRKDGAYVVVESHGHFMFDDAGRPLRMIGFLSDVTERTRIEEERAAEAAVSAALARVGRELISSLETPVVLERLCHLTTEVLDCDFSTTWMLKRDANVYNGVASYGIAPEHWDAMRLLHVPAASSTLLGALAHDDVLEVHRDDPGFPILTGMLAYYGSRVVICIALRRGSEIIGLHTVGYRDREGGFTPAQTRIARGIAQLASMALTNATLVEEIESAGRLKSEFVSTMSHELRTPLNVILGYTDILAEDLANTEHRTLLGRVRQSSLELLEMIEATLNLNRLAAGKDLPQMEPLRLGSLWDDLRVEFAALPRTGDVTLRWEPVGDTTLHTDRRKLKMILKNLVGNALKFTPAGEITIGCAPAGDAAVLTVRDTGIGIPPEHLPHVFDMFRQVDSSDRRSYGGAGLGLYIVRQLIDQLGGTIAVESTPGKGSIFTIHLPAAPQPSRTSAETAAA